MTDPREAKIEAVWPQYEVKDLNLTLKAKGPPVFVSKMRADLSRDLSEAERLGAVRVTWVKRCLVSKPPKPPAPPSARRIKPAPKKQAEQPLDEDAIADKVAAKLMGNLDQRDAQLRKELREMVANGGTVDTAKLAELLATGIAEKLPAPQQVVVQQGSGGQAVGQTVSDEPHYIPSKIIPTDAKASIQASKTKSDAGQTDDAAAKLAALRRKKKSEEPNE